MLAMFRLEFDFRLTVFSLGGGGDGCVGGGDCGGGSVGGVITVVGSV
jgi:hypothetical protein